MKYPKVDRMNLEVSRICRALARPNIHYVVVRTITPAGVSKERLLHTLGEFVTLMARLGQKSIQYLSEADYVFDRREYMPGEPMRDVANEPGERPTRGTLRTKKG